MSNYLEDARVQGARIVELASSAPVSNLARRHAPNRAPRNAGGDLRSFAAHRVLHEFRRGDRLRQSAAVMLSTISTMTRAMPIACSRRRWPEASLSTTPLAASSRPLSWSRRPSTLSRRGSRSSSSLASIALAYSSRLMMDRSISSSSFSSAESDISRDGSRLGY